MTELKPCPFCGGKAEAWESTFCVWKVFCTECGAKMEITTDADADVLWNKRVGDANKTIENVITCGECKYFERLSPDNINGYCTSEEVASDDEGGACFSCSRSEDDYCSFGWKGKEKL